MKNKVFVDSGGWIACLNEKDEHYKFAIEYYNEIRKNNIPIYTSNYIIQETLTWLNYNNFHDKAVKAMELWKKAEKSNLLTTVWVKRDTADEAWEIFKRYKEHRLSFADCTSFAICREHNINKVFGFDSDFNTLGFLLSPYQVHEESAYYDVLRPQQ